MSDTGTLQTMFGNTVDVRSLGGVAKMSIDGGAEVTLPTVTVPGDPALALKENLNGSWELSYTGSDGAPVRFTGHDFGEVWGAV